MSFTLKSIAGAALLLTTIAQADLTLRPGQSVLIANQRIFCSSDPWNPGPGPGPNPGPFPPGGDDRACRVLGPGNFNGFNYSFRLQAGRYGNIVEASNDLRSILSSMDRYVSYGNCSRPYNSTCDLDGTSTYNGFRYSFGLTVDGQPLLGASDLRAIIQAKDDLKRSGFCSAPTYRTCNVSGPGNYEGFNYRYTVQIDGRTIFGTNDTGSVDRMMSDLRYNGFCR